MYNKTIRKRSYIPLRTDSIELEEDTATDLQLDDTNISMEKITNALAIFRSSERYRYREAFRNHFKIKNWY